MPYLSFTDPLPDGRIVGLPVYVQGSPGVPGFPVMLSWQDGGSTPMAVLAPDLEATAGATVQWHTRRPMGIGKASAAQSVAASAWLYLNLPTVVTDSYAMFEPGFNLTEYSTPYTNVTNFGGVGSDVYLTSGYVTWAGTNSSGTNYIAGIAVNNGTPSEGAKLSTGTTGSHDVVCYVADIAAIPNASTPVQIGAYQNSAGALNTQGSSKPSLLQTLWIGATNQTPIASQPITPHTWIDQDEVTADATGASSVSPGVKVPLNREVRDLGYFLTNPPIARLTSQGSSQTITNGGTYQSVQMPTNSIDAYGGWSSGANTRYTAQRAGLYLVIGYVSVGESSGTHDGYRSVQLKQTFQAGGSTTFPGTSMTPSVGTNTIGTALHAIAMVRMAVGDYIEVQMAQTQTNTPTSLTVNTGTGNCSKLLAIWLSL